MVIKVQSGKPFTLRGMLLLAFWPMVNSIHITDEEAALLQESPKDIFCFSRTFEDLTCFWDEVDREYRFFYMYKGEQYKECMLIKERLSDGSWRHICIFPRDHNSVKLFIELYVEVLDSFTNNTILSQNLSVDTVGLISPPENVTAEWPKVANQLHVTWDPPHLSYVEFLAYEVLYGVEDSQQPPCRIEVRNSHTCRLSDLLPGQQYYIQVRTKPDGLSLDGLWGLWSPSVLAKTPHLPGEIDLQCFTPDLHQLHCQWKWDPTELGPSHSVLYWAEDNSSSTRTETWHECKEDEESIKPHYHTSFHICTFQPSNSSDISVLVTVTRGQSQKPVNYFKEPFGLHQVVLTAPPRILHPNVGKGLLKLEWVAPLEVLAEHLVYQIRYAVQDSLKWKVLHVQNSTNCEILDLLTGSHYCLQLRTRPDGQKYQGFWSAWSSAECIEIPPGSGTTVLSVAITLLFCAGIVVVLGFTCLSTYSRVKEKLWPPIPDLQHVLDGFLEDNSKQDQQMNAFFCNKTLENAPLTCPLEVLSEMPLDTRTSGPLPDVMEQMAWENHLSSYQHYMMLSPSSTPESSQENEYFDGTLDGSDAFLVPLEHGSYTFSNPKVHLGSFTLCSVPPSPSEMKEERSADVSGEQSTSPTHISNQSYLLMG